MIRCKEAKQNLLLSAVKHYKKNNHTFTFISLYDDEEPYPIEEVIYALRCKCNAAKREIDSRQNSPNMEVLETIYHIAHKNLEDMKRAERRIAKRRYTSIKKYRRPRFTTWGFLYMTTPHKHIIKLLIFKIFPKKGFRVRTTIL